VFADVWLLEDAKIKWRHPRGHLNGIVLVRVRIVALRRVQDG
jgi:hypothetical protein